MFDSWSEWVYLTPHCMYVMLLPLHLVQGLNSPKSPNLAEANIKGI